MAQESNQGKLAFSEVFPDVKVAPLPAGQKLDTVFILMKTVSEDPSDERAGWSWASPGAGIRNHEELLGALIAQTDLLREQMLSRWED